MADTGLAVDIQSAGIPVADIGLAAGIDPEEDIDLGAGTVAAADTAASEGTVAAVDIVAVGDTVAVDIAAAEVVLAAVVDIDSGLGLSWEPL